MRKCNAPKWDERERDLPNVAGLTYRQIGERWGCSASRAMQVVRAITLRASLREKREKMPTPLTDEWLLDDTTLSARCRYALKNEGILTVGDVRGKRASELQTIPNFGRKTFHELRTLIGKGFS